MEITGSAKFYEDKVHEIMARLESDTTETGIVMKVEAQRLVALFRTWSEAPPSYEERIAGMNALFKLNRQFLEHTDSSDGIKSPE